jgi:hypothetical protein
MKNGTRMTRINLFLIRVNPLNLRHPRTIGRLVEKALAHSGE